MRLSNLQETGFWANLEKAAEFGLVSFLWVMLSLPLITLPAATAGLFAVHTDWAQGKESEAFQRFFSAVWQYARKATLIGLGSAVGLGLVAFNFMILPRMELPAVLFAFAVGISVFVGWLILMTNLYIWVLLPVYDLPATHLVQTALQLAVRHVLWSTGVLLAAICVFLAGLWLLPAGCLTVVMASSLAWIISRGCWRVIRLYQHDLATLFVAAQKDH
ncbi:MAG: DUF624 domain-containing protein [Anaerolineae bacterium]|nr:DUF624 domain-containing protein [Anaerolineae bacterium]